MGRQACFPKYEKNEEFFRSTVLNELKWVVVVERRARTLTEFIPGQGIERSGWCSRVCQGCFIAKGVIKRCIRLP